MRVGNGGVGEFRGGRAAISQLIFIIFYILFIFYVVH